MLRPRLIASLLVDQQLHLVKTRRFVDRYDLGDPLNAAYVFSGFEVDELLVLDIDATPQGRCIPLAFVEALARFTSVPLTVGGGIRSLEQIHDLLAVGVEKVALSSVLATDFAFLQQAAERFGSSTISVVLNANSSAPGGPLAWFGRPNSQQPGQALIELALAVQQAGAGELIVQAVDRDGLRQGYAVSQLAELNDTLSIPLVALGGCGLQDHLAELLRSTPLSGLAAGSLFVYAPQTPTPHGRQVLLNYPPTHRWLQQQWAALQDARR